MYHIFFIAKNNAKKQKGDIITLVVLALLASFLLYTGVSIMAGIGNVMETAADEHNTSHVYYWLPDEAADELEKIFEENKDVAESDRSRADLVSANYRNPKTGEDWSSFQFIFGAFDEERTINTLSVDTASLTDKDALIPYYIKPQYDLGDKIEFKMGDDIYSYNVAGYVADPMFASSINISVYNIYLTTSELDRLTEAHKDLFVRGSSLKYRGSADCDIYALHNALWDKYQTWYSENTSRNTGNVMETNWWDMKGGGSFMTQIVMAVFTIFALLIIVIAMIIISFSIRNFIERNMKNTGILEAAGYKTGELSLAIVAENLIASLAGSVLGVILAAVASEGIGSVVAIISGLPWNQGYNYGVAAATVAGISAMVVIVCLISSRQYARVPVLDCLRGGINNHNFKRNHFPFEKSSLPVPFTLSLKELFGDKRRNLVLVLIIAIITISNNVGFALVGTFGGRTDAILKLSGIESPSAQITGSRALEKDIRAMECADHVLLYYQAEPTLRSGDMTTTCNCDVYDDPSLIENNMMLEGRLPVSSREICLTRKVANGLGVGVGDIIYVDFGGNSYDYVVSGLDQKINHMGLKGMFTDEGARRFIGTQDTLMYYIYGKEGYSFDDIAAECGRITSTSVDDSAKILTETVSTVSNSMSVICIAILAVTGMVVVFVEILLVRSKIIRERRNYGINKALGFTSGQLMSQTMISNIPSIMIGVLLGIALSASLSSRLMSAALMFFGIEKVDIEMPLYGLVLTFIGILAVAMITSLMCSLSIRKVEPVGLLSEE